MKMISARRAVALLCRVCGVSCERGSYLKMKLVISVLFAVSSLSFSRGQSCKVPGGGDGRCISVMSCPSLAALLTKPTRTPAEIQLLQGSACGFEGSMPKVCCPQSCYTPDGREGNCVDIHQCAHLANMLRPPISSEVRQYFQRSRCNGPSQYSVCCGPPPQPQPTNIEVDNCENRVFVYPPDPRTQCCGIESNAESKIMGGQLAGIDEYPWLAIIEYAGYETNNNIKLLCGGTLISSRYVLTAGHCLTGKVLAEAIPKNVRLGEYDTRNNGPDCVDAAGGGQDCNEPVVIVPIEKTIPHPEYNILSHKNDIGLIRLRENAPYTDFIRPICLPDSDVTLTPPPFILTAAGWGAVNETVSKSPLKLYVDLPFVNKQQCQSVYTRSGRKANIGDTQVCAGGQKGQDSCRGDSGGPLMFSHKNILRVDLVGVVSFGPKPCGIENIPGVYTKVFEYKSWINSVIKP